MKTKTMSVLLVGLMSLTAFASGVVIDEPSESRAYQRPAQNVDIVVSVGALRPTDTLVVTLNDQFLGVNQTSFSIPTVDLNPDKYVIVAKIQDEAGRTIASDSKEIFVIQNTNAIKLKKAEQAKKDAKAKYDALPWYKKAYYTMRQDVQTPK